MNQAQLKHSFSLIADQEYPGQYFPATVEEAVERWGAAMLEYYGSMAAPVPGGGGLVGVAIESFKQELKAGIEAFNLKLDPLFNNLHSGIAASVDSTGLWRTTIPYQLGAEEHLLSPDDYLGTSAQVIDPLTAAIDARTHATFSQMTISPYTIVFWV